MGMLFIPGVTEVFRGPKFLVPPIIFSILGGVLLFLTKKEKVKGRLRKFLILTGASATGFFISVFLHNFLYAAAILTSQITLLRYLFEVLHTVFFFIAVPLCPLGFLIGAVGSIVILIKKRRR